SIEEKLEAVTQNYRIWTREQVFDRVKEVCGAITGLLKKESSLLLKRLTPSGELATAVREAQSDARRVEDEIGQLVEVHVDEPHYESYLENLLKVMRNHLSFSKKLFATIKEKGSQQEINNINVMFNDMMLHSVDFNTTQAP